MAQKKLPRFTFGAIANIEKDIEGVDFRDLSTFVDDNAKLLAVIQSAFKTGGASEADAAKWANEVTRGEFIDAYAEDMGISAVKKLAAPASTQ